MSKRFGRNQRRRARERIAELEERGTRMRKAVATRDERIRDLEEHIKYVAAVLGHMNVLAGEKLEQLEGCGDRMQVYVPEPMSSPFMDMDETEVACVEIMRLLEVEAVRDMAGRSIHAIVCLADKKAAYAISETALRKMPREALRKLLERQVAPLLCAILAEVAGKP